MTPIRTFARDRSRHRQSVRTPLLHTESMPLGRMLIAIGVVLVGVGLLFSFGGRLPFRLGRLPGDIYFQGKNSSFYFPIATCILLSILLSVVMWIIRKL